jgi:hypothetical protein
MGLFPKINLLVFCAYLIRIGKRYNFVRENFYSSLFSLRKHNLKIQFSYNKNDRSFFSVSFFSEKIEFSQRKKARIEKKIYKVVSFFDTN